MSDRGLIAGLVLAAGASVRHPGGSKLLLPFDDGTVVSASVRGVATAGLRPIVVVVGHRAGEVRDAVGVAMGDEEIEFVENPRYREGVAGSLSVGLGRLAAQSDVKAAAILLGDEPGVSPAVIRAVADAWRGGAPIARAVYRDRPGHPVIVDRSLFTILQGGEGDRGLNAVLGRCGLDFVPVHIEREAPVDIDTPADYRRAIRHGGEDEGRGSE
jgi:molybdenum cofactor cytidylyltransferase